MVGKTLETIYSTFFTWCCFPYVHFWELYLSCVYCLCVFVVLGVFVVLLCVFVVLLMCIYCTLCVFVVLCVYCCFLDAGLLARSQYLEGTATGHLDTGFSWFPCVYKRMLRWFPSFQVATTCLSCSPPYLNFLVTFSFFFHIRVHVK